MSMRDRLVEQGKELASSGAVLRLMSNDRVMRVATGVMDARTRLRTATGLAAEAWNVLLNGHALPTIDPALEGDDEVRARPLNGGAHVNGNGAARADAAQ